jgi:hypothetical protein
MPGIYAISPTDVNRPADNDEVQYAAAELRSLKNYLQTQLVSMGIVSNSDYNKIQRNLLINGEFSIGAAGNVMPDRWKSTIVGTSALTVVPTAFTFGQNLVPDDPAKYLAATFTLDSAITAKVTIEQRVESVRVLSSSNIGAPNAGMLSFWAKGTTALNLGVDNYQSFGTGGTPSADSDCTVGATKVALTTTWTKYTIPVTVNDLTGKILGTSGTDYLGIRFWLSSGSNFNARNATMGAQAGTIWITQAQLVIGGVAVPYQYRTQGEEQALCNRYVQRLGGVASAALCMGGATATTTVKGVFPLPTSMRAAPTIAVAGTIATAYSVVGGTTIAPSALTAAALDPNQAILTATVAGATVGQAYMLTTVNTTAVLTCSAEL